MFSPVAAPHWLQGQQHQAHLWAHLCVFSTAFIVLICSCTWLTFSMLQIIYAPSVGGAYTKGDRNGKGVSEEDGKDSE
jgi:hypothetical protein